MTKTHVFNSICLSYLVAISSNK